jgi:hypothetical protein
MNATSDSVTIHDHWVEDPVRLSPRDECRRARRAWDLVAPADGLLPADATPLQRMLYARMTTSIFVYEATQQRTGAQRARISA